MNPWKTIFSAPKDGTKILARVNGGIPAVIWWHHNHWLVQWNGEVVEPALWMEIPPLMPESGDSSESQGVKEGT